jgi:N-acetylglucosaminyldiphosphoundecaprenol N-acetyl-beta-D-mannosaminyltransferase
MLNQILDERGTPSFNLLNVDVQALRMKDLNGIIAQAIERNQRLVIANHNLHSVYLCQYDSDLRAYYRQSSYTHVDGMPLIWIGQLLGYPLRREHRVTYVDWLEPLMNDAVQYGWRVFYLGAKPGVAERGALRLRSQFPGLSIATHHGHFDASPDSEETVNLIQQINAFKTNILFVGMGMPRQEHWIQAHRNRLEANIILPCGAAIDYVSGEVATPPRWMGRVGLEWLFRLVSQPQRLASRYLMEPWFLVGPFAKSFCCRYLTTRSSATTRTYDQPHEIS